MILFFFNDTATTEIYTLSLHDALPIWCNVGSGPEQKRADELARMLRPSSWQRLSAGEGAKGPRLYDWARGHLCRLAEPQWGHWLLVRGSISKHKEMAYYVVFAPRRPDLQT